MAAWINDLTSVAIILSGWYLTAQSARYRGIFTFPASAACAAITLGTLFILLFRNTGMVQPLFWATIVVKLAVATFLGVVAYRIHCERIRIKRETGNPQRGAKIGIIHPN